MIILIHKWTRNEHFNVPVSYEAVPGKDGAHQVKDAKGNLKEFKKAEFETPANKPVESYGTIKVSDASPATKLIIEERAPKRDKAPTKAPGKQEKEEFPGKIGDKYKVTREKRFKTTFTISQ